MDYKSLWYILKLKITRRKNKKNKKQKNTNRSFHGKVERPNNKKKKQKKITRRLIVQRTIRGLSTFFDFFQFCFISNSLKLYSTKKETHIVLFVKEIFKMYMKQLFFISLDTCDLFKGQHGVLKPKCWIISLD